MSDDGKPLSTTASNPEVVNVGRSSPPGDFHLDDWFVQPELCRLSRNGTVVRVRPQLMDLLVCLSSQPGQTLSREELFARVWPGQYVVETALARCVAELRQLLEDDAHAPRVIETIPKRGYRLLLPVRAVAPPAPAGPPVPAAAPAIDAADGAALWVRTLRACTSFRLGRARPRHIVAALLACVALGAITAWRLSNRAPIRERSGVVVAFTNATGEAVFDGTLTLALAIQLEQSPYLKLIPAERVREALKVTGQPGTSDLTPAAARDACRRLGGQAVLTGSISLLGRRYVIGLEAITCGTADVLAREQAEVEGRENVLAAVSRVAAGMRRRLGESLASVAKYDVSPARTSAALTSLRAVALGDDARGTGRDLEAVRQYRFALEADPACAIAHVRLGVVLGEAGRIRESAEHIAKAYALRDRVGEPERIYIDAHYQARVVGNLGRAAALFEQWQQAHPDSDIPAINLAKLYAMLGRHEEAIVAGRNALRLDPGYVPVLDLLCGVQMALGHFDAALAEADERIRRGTDTPSLHRRVYEMAFATGALDRMAAETAWAEAHPDGLASMREAQADAAAFGGRRGEATRAWAGIVAAMKEAGDTSGVAHHYLGQAYAEALWGDAARAGGLARRAVAEQPTAPVALAAARVLAVARDARAAEEMLDQCGTLGGTGRSSLPPELDALLAVARNEPRRALALLPPAGAVELGLGSQFTTIWIRAEAHRHAGDAVRAAAEYRRILEHRGVSPSSVLYPAAQHGLARALAAARDWPGARAAYQRLLALWQRADADLPSLQAALRELSALPPH